MSDSERRRKLRQKAEWQAGEILTLTCQMRRFALDSERVLQADALYDIKTARNILSGVLEDQEKLKRLKEEQAA